MCQNVSEQIFYTSDFDPPPIFGMQMEIFES